MNENGIEIKNILKDSIVFHIPLKYMMNAIKIEIENLPFNRVNVDLYQIEIKGLIPGKTYENLYLKIFDTNDEFKKFKIDSFKTLEGNNTEKMIVKFYEEVLEEEIKENKFNYWNRKISSNEKTFKEFCEYVLKINKFSVKKLSDMEFLNLIYRILINDFTNDVLYFWTFYFEFKLKSLSVIDRRKEIFSKIFQEYSSSCDRELIY